MEAQNEALMRANEIAAQATQKYVQLYDFAPSGYFTLSKRGEIIESNLRGAKMLGKERANLRKAQFGFFVSNETKPNFNHFLRKAFRSHNKEICELTLYIEGKLPTFVFLSGIVGENENQCLITMVETNDRKRVDELLVESVIRYRRLFESSKDGILILDAESGRILAVNPYMARLLGFSETQLIDQEIWKFEVFKDVADNQEKFLELQKKKYVHYDDLPLNTKDGRRIDVEFVSKVYLEYKKKIIQCNIREITERKRVDELLVESEIRYRRLFESAKDGILILDAETGKVLAVNPFLIKLLEN
jgi:PAS domain S-box-containing protein